MYTICFKTFYLHKEIKYILFVASTILPLMYYVDTAN